jgi:hypothetical protein
MFMAKDLPRQGGADGSKDVCLAANASDTAPNPAPNQAKILRKEDPSHRATHPYGQMSIAQICALSVGPLAHAVSDDAPK